MIIGFLFVFPLLVWLHLMLRDRIIGIVSTIIASIILSVILVELISWVGQIKRESRVRHLPFFQMGLVIIYTNFCFPIFFPNTSIFSGIRVSSDMFDYAMLGTLLFFFSFILGYKRFFRETVKRRKLIYKWLPKIKNNNYNEITFAVWTMLLISDVIAILFTGRLSMLEFGNPIMAVLLFIFEPSIVFGFHIYFYIVKKISARTIYISFAIAIIPAVINMTLHQIFLMIGTLAVSKFYVSKKLPIFLFFALVLGYIILNPVKLMYRGIIQEHSVDSLSGKIETIASGWSVAWEERNDIGKRDTMRNAGRFNELILVADCMNKVPDVIDYGYGWSWRIILYNFIPRLLWTDKPILNDIGSSYWAWLFGYTSSTSLRETAANLPSIVDGYWNFGWLGISFIGLLFGFVGKFYAITLNLQQPETVAAGVFLLKGFLTNRSLPDIVGAIPQKIIGIVVSLLLLKLLILMYSSFRLRRN